MIVVKHGRREMQLAWTHLLPATFGGRARMNVQNALAAAAAAFAAGAPLHDIRQGLRSFSTNYYLSPGRLNEIEVNGVNVIVDYCHNAPGMRMLGDFVDRVGDTLESVARAGPAVADRRHRHRRRPPRRGHARARAHRRPALRRGHRPRGRRAARPRARRDRRPRRRGRPRRDGRGRPLQAGRGRARRDRGGPARDEPRQPGRPGRALRRQARRGDGRAGELVRTQAQAGARRQRRRARPPTRTTRRRPTRRRAAREDPRPRRTLPRPSDRRRTASTRLLRRRRSALSADAHLGGASRCAPGGGDRPAPGACGRAAASPCSSRRGRAVRRARTATPRADRRRARPPSGSPARMHETRSSDRAGRPCIVEGDLDIGAPGEQVDPGDSLTPLGGPSSEGSICGRPRHRSSRRRAHLLARASSGRVRRAAVRGDPVVDLLRAPRGTSARPRRRARPARPARRGRRPRWGTPAMSVTPTRAAPARSRASSSSVVRPRR